MTKQFNVIQIKITGDRINNIPKNLKLNYKGIGLSDLIEMFQGIIEKLEKDLKAEASLIV